jgi:S-formylglutathione hydrolase FrmB
MVLAALAACPVPGDEAARATSLRFEVTLAPGLVSAPQDGRLLVVLGRPDEGEPRHTIGHTGLKTPPLLGRDVTGFTAGQVAALDRSAAIFPIASLDVLPAGDYAVQAVLATNRDLNLPSAPGNFYSVPRKVRLDAARGGTVAVELTKQIPPEALPPDTDRVKFVKLKSELLSRFHGRPIYLRAGVVLPPDFDREPTRRYPLRVHIGGYGSRYTNALGRARGDGGPPMLVLHLDGAGPYGDPYQVNSANNGPYGDAVTQELIPYVERRFRGIGQPYARVLDGASTGGWVSLALQVFYPDFFNGTWSHCPDPVDFRAYELINIYRDDNAYVNQHGFERPAMRERGGDVVYTVRHEVQMENVLGRGDSWTTSGKDWCAWNATFGPRDGDGRPKPLWDPRTGKIDRSVLPHWEQYDLRLVLERNWKALGPKLRGKLHIWVGEADDYFLNNAVHLLDDFLARAEPPYGGKITFGPRGGHSWQGISERQMVADMLAAVEAARR